MYLLIILKKSFNIGDWMNHRGLKRHEQKSEISELFFQMLNQYTVGFEK
jgi:hypothetical protein